MLGLCHDNGKLYCVEIGGSWLTVYDSSVAGDGGFILLDSVQEPKPSYHSRPRIDRPYYIHPRVDRESHCIYIPCGWGEIQIFRLEDSRLKRKGI